MTGPEHTNPATSRRAFLRRAGLGAVGLAIGGPALLAACSSGGAGSGLRIVRVYNEPLGLDDNTPGLFEASTGVFLKYYEYTDAAEFLKRATPSLQAHHDMGADVVILPDLQTARMIEAGFAGPVVKTQPSLMPAAFAHPAFDPSRRFSLPWSSTMVGLAYDRRRVGEAPVSARALFDPRFAGKVVLSTDAAATLGLVMLASGQDPATVTPAQATAAVARVRAAVASGQVRSFATTEYIDELTSGRALIAVARASEVRESYALSHNIKFVVPTEGGLLESTNMLVPVGATNVAEAGVFMRYMFSPDPNSRLASFGGRVATVVGADRSLAAIDAKAATDPLVVPPPAVMARLKIWGGNAATNGATSAFAALAAAHSASSPD